MARHHGDQPRKFVFIDIFLQDWPELIRELS
jgi:hypothetical protein